MDSTTATVEQSSQEPSGQMAKTATNPQLKRQEDDKPPPLPAKSGKPTVVDASVDLDPKSKLQKFFCDELLAKQ